MRLMCVVTVLLMSVPAAFADGDAASSDTTYTFRFYRGSTKLFVPTFGNDTELERLEACVARYADDILAGRLPLYVDGIPHYENTMTAAEPTAPAAAADKRFSLRANLLRWATLTPDLGIEWRANDRWSLLFNASWTTWSWNDKDRRYALREFMPEVRYHFGAEKHWGGVSGLAVQNWRV